ncbi:MAG: OmpH family outer membrane protein [Flavobacteriia bacterium]|nr:OmpH family outer membrane protein [Flavobacteriia bacterium]
MKLIYIALIGLTSAAVFTACSEEKKTDKEVEAPSIPTVDPQGLKIAFYESDSLNEGFTFLKTQDSLLKIKQEKFQRDLESRQRNLEAKYNALVEGEQKMLYTAAELQSKKTEFERQSQSLQLYQQNEGTKLQDEAMEMQKVLQNKVSEFSKRYCEKYKIDMLIMHGEGGQFSYYNPKMDVTKSFIEFVNAEQKKL